MTFQGQTMNGMADGKQKKYLSGLETDDPYQKYISQKESQPNEISSQLVESEPEGVPTGGSGDGNNGNGNNNESIGYNYDSSKPPTIDELMNMGTDEIAQIFGGGDKDWMEEYGMYIPEYDPYQEQAREKEYELTTSGMRNEATTAKRRLANQFKTMNTDFNQGDLQNQMIDSVSNQFDLANLGKDTDIRGMQESYYGDVMQAMQHLNEVGAFDKSDDATDWDLMTDVAKWEHVESKWDSYSTMPGASGIISQLGLSSSNWSDLSQEERQKVYDYIDKHGGFTTNA